MGRLADRFASYVQAEIGRAITKGMASLSVGTVVTSPSQVTANPLTVVFDGSALAVPVKQVRGLPLVAGARVVLGRFGSDWVVLGGLTNPATGTGTSRIAIGADVPAELKAYGIDTAILVYLNDKVTNQEMGYFFIGSSNRFDGNGDARVLAYGNVTYPTLGNPASATMSDVRTNFQQDTWAQYQSTVFKDHKVRFWTDISLEPNSGMDAFQIDGKDVHFVIGEALARANAITNASAAAGPTLIPGTQIVLASNSSTNDYAECTATVDFLQGVASATTAVVELMVNGVAQTGQAIFSGVVAGARATCGQTWRVDLTAAPGNQTFQLRITKAAGTDNHISAQAIHTSLRVKIIEDI